MRIITGIYKGRHFDIPRTFKARPTTDFAKENLFNVLNGYIDFEGASALDLFSGTGSISFEMLSRGCNPVVSVEMDAEHVQFIKNCTQKLKAEGHIIVRKDVFRFIKTTQRQFDLIFADPPYQLETLPTIPDLIFEHNLLSSNGIFILEHGKNHDFSQHPNVIDHRVYGSVNFTLFK
ncbi:MAG: 16S rRNA (guanine(966)-N(2))-methyltransferase RsmD [Prevotella sp.]|nr:16S rRNA (guanine(966)-N(2))-methyltransferase RsmD [Prevotella sp.]MBR6455615.1 16S rRNA (guanine(966)-N(2))-methyltransferase RsmD [Prevotella sp.]